MRGIPCLWCVTVVALVAGGCSRSSGPPRQPTYPLTGVVTVDGQPAKEVRVAVHPAGATDPESAVATAFTDENGKFSLSTYESGDGVPEGEYVVTFMWGTINPFSFQYGPPDKLNGRYADPAKSQFRVKVEKGKPADMGTISLSTK
ncbi:MAG: hypothetical protein KatS3mg110_2408 [Pirellulaceae bacterium]|nr:MAG: hypothetical protein KatS3mg110_2408 [Pirellulaceae bacterium]